MTFRVTQVFPPYLERRQSRGVTAHMEAHTAVHLHDKDDFLKRKWNVSCTEAEVHPPEEMFFCTHRPCGCQETSFASEDLLCWLNSLWRRSGLVPEGQERVWKNLYVAVRILRL